MLLKFDYFISTYLLLVKCNDTCSLFQTQVNKTQNSKERTTPYLLKIPLLLFLITFDSPGFSYVFPLLIFILFSCLISIHQACIEHVLGCRHCIQRTEVLSRTNNGPCYPGICHCVNKLTLLS